MSVEEDFSSKYRVVKTKFDGRDMSMFREIK